MKRNSFSIIGGDARNLAVASQLCRLGMEVHMFGFNASQDIPQQASLCENLCEAASCSRYIVLPLPVSEGNGLLRTPLYDGTIFAGDVIRHITADQMLFGGKLPQELCEMLEQATLPYVDYAKRDEFAAANAVPTAEGAIEIALRETPFTLNGANCLVTGFGRISKILAHFLQGLGAHVTVAARRFSDLSTISAFGYTAVHTKDIPGVISDFQIIFNTVPALLFNENTLALAAKDVLLIDLASKPGGADDILDNFFAFLKEKCSHKSKMWYNKHSVSSKA